MDILIISRGNPSSHPVLKNYGRFFKRKGYEVVFLPFSIRGLLKIGKKIRAHRGVILCADPVPAIYISILGKPFNMLSMEMFEYQLPNNSVKNILRNLFFRVFHRIALRRAKKVVFCNSERRDFYQKRIPSLSSKSLTIENYHSKDDLVFQPLPNDIRALIESARESYDSIFIYAGGLQIGRYIPELISTFQSLPQKFLILAGKDNAGMSDIRLSKNVVYLGQLEKPVLNSLLNKCDYGFMFYGNNILNTKYCAPVKLYEYNSLKLNILANDNLAMQNRKEFVFDIWHEHESLKKFIESLPLNPTKELVSAAPDWDMMLEEIYRSITSYELGQK
jgi:glycosyltransferase involved in cell wall biosynthesis